MFSLLSKLLKKSAKLATQRRKSSLRRCVVESLEGRSLLATLTVINTNDSGAGSLRDAIIQANSAVGADTIAFAIPGAGVKVISPITALPNITGTVIIDGTTQGASATPLIQLDGSAAPQSANGLKLTAGASTIKNLAITNFKQNGILIQSSGNVVQGAFIGVNPSGNSAAPNVLDGIQILGVANNLIGGTTSSALNLISGNARNGINITGAGATGNIVIGNRIGLNLSATSKVPNPTGVRIAGGAAFNLVGGETTAERNQISGNTNFGVLIEGAGTSNNQVKGNFIGNGSGVATLLGNGNGVTVRSGATINTIGSTNVAGKNVISANQFAGVQLRGTGTSQNLVFNNFIGTNETGNSALGNGQDGVVIDTGASLNSVGATDTTFNVISGNARSGILISGSTSTSNQILANHIGLNATGLGAIANLQSGVTVRDSAKSNVIGKIGVPNFISGNSGDGIRILGAGTSNNVVEANIIGLNKTLSAALANTLDGVAIEQGATSNTIGGEATSKGNVLSGNKRAGLRIAGTGTDQNIVVSNKIGVNLADNVGLGNQIGVWIVGGAKSNKVGLANQGNQISGNLSAGVSISGAGTSGNTLIGNSIGVSFNGLSALGNFDGVSVNSGATGNTIGGTTTAERNFISGNSHDGIQIAGATTTGNLVVNNLIGLATTGINPIPNLRHGVSILSGASGNSIGSTTGPSNFISGNGGAGISISDLSSSANIVNNIIGLDTSNVAMQNIGSAIQIISGGTANIGGTSVPARNVLAGGSQRILIDGPSTQNVVVQGNYIGTDTTGAISRNNSGSGIRISNGAHHVTIGGSSAGQGNLISGNQSFGIAIQNGAVHDVTIQGNLIGTNAAGTANLSNATGIRLDESPGVLIGGSTAAARNVISGSIFDAITITGGGNSQPFSVQVVGNFIGLSKDGLSAIPNKDGMQISLQDKPVLVSKNHVSGNTRFGIRITDSQNQLLTGNKIGVKGDNTSALGNGSHGVFVTNQARNNRIGGPAAADANTIAFNGGDGVLIGSDIGQNFNTEAGSGNSVIRNLIFGNIGTAIDLGSNNGSNGNDIDDADTGANNLQNKAALSFASSQSGTTFIRGKLDSVVGNFRIDFYSGSINGDAEIFLGSLTDSIVSSLDLEFAVFFNVSVPVGKILHAVVTNLDTGDSSELSNGIVVV